MALCTANVSDGVRLGHSAMSVQCPVYSKGNIGARFVTTHAKASWRGNRRSERIGFGRNVAHVSTWQRRTGRVSEDAGRRGAPAGKPRRAGDRRLAGTRAILCGDAGARRSACHFGQPIRPTGNHRRHRARGGRGKFRGHGRDTRRFDPARIRRDHEAMGPAGHCGQQCRHHRSGRYTRRGSGRFRPHSFDQPARPLDDCARGGATYGGREEFRARS